MHVLILHATDLMAVREIPLKERPYILSDGPSRAAEADGDEFPEDTAVSAYTARIRDMVRKDRALNDKANQFARSVAYFNTHTTYPRASKRSSPLCALIPSTKHRTSSG
jgi:hypothetical protein